MIALKGRNAYSANNQSDTKISEMRYHCENIISPGSAKRVRMQRLESGEIIIVIDTREQKNEYIKNRLDSIGIPCEITTLPEATGCDYYIANTHGSCGIQRKDSTKELILQMEDLHYDILPRLCNFTDNPVLLVEESHVIGEMGYLFRKENRLWLETGMHSSSYYGFLETVRQMGIDVVCTRDLNQSIWYMAALHGYLGKYHYPRHKKTFRISQQAVGMLACVPGIAEKRAREVLEKHSIREICTMERIDGLTEKQCEKIKRVLEWKE